MKTKPLLTRKDIALLLVDCSPDQVRKNEKRWGLDRARRDLNSRNVRYSAEIALTILRVKGFVR
jgi:hypothetical protein